MRAGAIDGLSIGFRTVRGRTDAKSGVRSLIEVDLWEVSVVTFPMLPAARVERGEGVAWRRARRSDAARGADDADALPPPLWGRAGEGARPRHGRWPRYPSPNPSPQGGGEKRVAARRDRVFEHHQ